VRAALTRALELRKKGQRVQVEVRTSEELEEALECGAEAILLDNMSAEQVRGSVDRIKKLDRWIPHRASGALCWRTFARTRRPVWTSSAWRAYPFSKAADISMSIVAE